MKRTAFHLFIALLTLSALVAVATQWGSLPARVPIHWNFKGEVDGWGPKWHLWMVACLPALMSLILELVLRFDPRRENFVRHRAALFATLGAAGVLMTVVFWCVFLSTLGHPVRAARIIPLSLGLALILMGNYLPQVKFNYSFGIRTPWTLSNEEVWTKTHRLGGRVFIALGLSYLLAAYWGEGAPYAILMAAAPLAAVVALFGYSWRLHAKRTTPE